MNSTILRVDDPFMLSALIRVMAARDASIAKHGILTADREGMERAGLILCEEAGEVAAEILKMGKPSGTGSHRGAKGTPEATLYELAQIAQHAIAMMMLLEQGIETDREADKHGNE